VQGSKTLKRVARPDVGGTAAKSGGFPTEETSPDGHYPRPNTPNPARKSHYLADDGEHLAGVELVGVKRLDLEALEKPVDQLCLFAHGLERQWLQLRQVLDDGHDVVYPLLLIILCLIQPPEEAHELLEGGALDEAVHQGLDSLFVTLRERIRV
jgi:hypothetical protein